MDRFSSHLLDQFPFGFCTYHGASDKPDNTLCHSESWIQCLIFAGLGHGCSLVFLSHPHKDRIDEESVECVRFRGGFDLLPHGDIHPFVGRSLNCPLFL